VFWYDRTNRSLLLSCQGHAQAGFVVRAGRDLIVVTRRHPGTRRRRVGCVFDGKRRLVMAGVAARDTVEIAGWITAERSAR
jgi:ABC-type ATPase involved in cell division